MSFKLRTEHHLEFLSLKGGCTGSSESTLVKMPHCWKSHVTAQLFVYWHWLCSFVDHFVIYVSCLSRFLVCSLQPCGHLLGKWLTSSLVCGILLCFCHLSVCCPGSGVVLDCIDFWSLPPYLLCQVKKHVQTVDESHDMNMDFCGFKRFA